MNAIKINQNSYDFPNSTNIKILPKIISRFFGSFLASICIKHFLVAILSWNVSFLKLQSPCRPAVIGDPGSLGDSLGDDTLPGRRGFLDVFGPTILRNQCNTVLVGGETPQVLKICSSNCTETSNPFQLETGSRMSFLVLGSNEVVAVSGHSCS